MASSISVAKKFNMVGLRASDEAVTPKNELMVAANLDDSDTELMMMIATTAYAENDLERALKIYSALEPVLPDEVDPVLGKAMVFHKMRKDAEAKAAYLKALEIDKEHQVTHCYFAELLWVMEDANGAIHHAEIAKQINPRTWHANRSDSLIAQIKWSLANLKPEHELKPVVEPKPEAVVATEKKPKKKRVRKLPL